MNCVVCGVFCRTRGTAVACDCIAHEYVHACCVERLVNEKGRCVACNKLLYRDGTWADWLIVWEETLVLHLRAALIDFLWMAFMYVGYNVPWALPGWGLYYIVQARALRSGKVPGKAEHVSQGTQWWRIARLAWILFFPVLNGMAIDSAAPRCASYPSMEGSAILADLLPLFFYSLCIERGKQALIWAALPRRAVQEKRERRAFLGVACAWWDTPVWIALLFGAAWLLYVCHVLIVRNAVYNVFLLPFWCGFVLLAASAAKPHYMPFVAQ